MLPYFHVYCSRKMTCLSFTFIASKGTSVKQVASVLVHCAFGALDSHEGIQMVVMKDGRRKFFVHYVTQTSTALSDRLNDFKVRKEAGEEVRPPRIIYGKKPNGTDNYWQIYRCQTLNEREANSLLDGW